MPTKLDITKQQREAIMKRYIAGQSPTEISQDMKHLGLSGRQITSMANREGWRPLRLEHLAEHAKHDPEQILAVVRRENAELFAQIVDDVFQDALNDHQKLSRSGWGLVDDAAGASSLMRAKKLLQERLFSVAGISQQPQQQATTQNNIAFYVAAPVDQPQKEAHGNIIDLDEIEVSFG